MNLSGLLTLAQEQKCRRAEWSNIEKALFAVPTKDIQHQIVHLLHGLDLKILDAIDMLEELQTMKKGLIQQLFI